MPFWIPAAIAAGSTLYSEWKRHKDKERNRSRMEKLKFTMPNFGAQRTALAGQLGEQATRAGRASLAGNEGVYDPGRQQSMARGFQANAGRAFTIGNAGIEAQENAAKQAESEFNERKAQYLDEYQANQPGFLDSLAGGIGLGASAYQMLYPQEFVPQYNMNNGVNSPFMPEMQKPDTSVQGFNLGFNGKQRGTSGLRLGFSGMRRPQVQSNWRYRQWPQTY